MKRKLSDMKKKQGFHRIIFGFLLFALIWMQSLPVSAEETASEEMADWTVMIYFCGSDLESLHGMATYNLKEMAGIHPEITIEEFLNQKHGTNYPVQDPYHNHVNVVFQTGGCKEWHAKKDLGIDISSDALQRWSFQPVAKDSDESPFTLMEEVPLASMSEPETLADFIQWSARTCPAQKYALVLWDHGGGGAKGIFIDELFDKDMMYLDELDQALAGGGVHFETVIMDACMMSCLEAAQAVAPYASYMVASEEVTSGYGSAFGSWLKELYLNPLRNGLQFGTCFCDLTMRKYAEMENTEAFDLLTYSVLDLSYVKDITEIFDLMYNHVDNGFLNFPEILSYMGRIMQNAEVYGTEQARMLDIGSIMYVDEITTLIPLNVRAQAQNALSNCVKYCVRGKDRAESTGLSFCYAAIMDSEDLDIYARNCKSPYYLAFLDAISDWTAPDYVYETAPHMENMLQNDFYNMDVELVESDGFPGAAIDMDNEISLGTTQYYEWYRYDERSEAYVRLGKDECREERNEDAGKIIYLADWPSLWPSIDGELCDIELVRANQEEILYNIPFRMQQDTYNLRCSYFRPEMTSEYQADNDAYIVYGIWSGYDNDTGVPNRNVSCMGDYLGREYHLCYPVYREEEEEEPYQDSDEVTKDPKYVDRETYREQKTEEAYYQYSGDLSMHKFIEVEEVPLPEGDYAVRYIMTDIYGREIPQEMAYLHWDGETYTRQDGR